MPRLKLVRPMAAVKDEYYSVKQVALMFGCRLNAIHHRVRSGSIPPCAVKKGPKGYGIEICVSRWFDIVEHVNHD